MRIAVVNTARNYGGQEAMAATLAEGLSARGHDVLFLCRTVYPAMDRVRPHVTLAPVLGGMDWNPLSVWRGRRALRDHGSEVMLATTNKDLRTAGLSAAWLGVPVVIRRAMARPLRDTAHYRWLYGRLPAHVVTNSAATHRIMLDSAPWLDEGRTSVVHNGIDVERFRTAEPVDLGVPAGAVAVGFVGRFVEWKGVLTLADAWRAVASQVPEAHLVLVGEGEMEGEMRSRLDGVERVHWTGFRGDVPRVMRSLDVLAFPSTMEGFGLAAVEGMAAGLPVIAAAAGSLPEVVGDGGAGIFHPPGDVRALADAIRTLVEDPERRAAMGEAGRRRAEEEFSLERMIDRYEALLARCAS